ncbi:polysaccharide lyase [Ruegeria sp. WL0004]|uniref:Polysaccharide lyase n=1 Tax=Ruegeria marisflavi TaxID=2984152 RepID=A0ABT2WMP6_9RHOB|nr:polysaccharide lyase [Ruegeria sp. WL0004]MCU9837168.1 polysaccharide lyase [Ruegeria sp. WL0004]
MLETRNSRRTIAQIAALIFVLLLGSPEVLAQAPSGFVVGTNSGVAPVVKNGEVIFKMRRGDCQKRPYGDGRGESDCANGNSRSQLNAREKQRMGRAYEYSMEIWVDPAFRYNGRGWGKVNYRSRLWIAEWQRSNTIKNHMYEMYLDSAKGVTFEDKRCFSPNRFGQWNSVVMRVKWSNGADGFLQVICNGREIYSLKGPNVMPPGCGEEWKQQCKPELQDLTKPILWSVGPSLKGHGMNYRDFGFPSAFPPFPEGGITLKMRNLYVGRIRS